MEFSWAYQKEDSQHHQKQMVLPLKMLSFGTWIFLQEIHFWQVDKYFGNILYPLKFLRCWCLGTLYKWSESVHSSWFNWNDTCIWIGGRGIITSCLIHNFNKCFIQLGWFNFLTNIWQHKSWKSIKHLQTNNYE